MSARSGEPFSEAREIARGMATTKFERLMIDAALALFLDKLRETHIIITEDDLYEAKMRAINDSRCDL